MTAPDPEPIDIDWDDFVPMSNQTQIPAHSWGEAHGYLIMACDDEYTIRDGDGNLKCTGSASSLAEAKTRAAEAIRLMVRTVEQQWEEERRHRQKHSPKEGR